MSATPIVVDTGYRPRPWQLKVHRGLKRSNVLVVHRRGGKTVLAGNVLIDDALRLELPFGRYGYIAPLLKQAKDIAWPYLKQYTANIPGRQVFEAELRIVLPNKGAQIRVYGANDPDSLRGTYFDGVVLDEYADMSPEVRDKILLPALTDRAGWELVLGTPRGVDAFYKLWKEKRDDPDWYVARFNYLDTGALSPEAIEKAKREMTREAFRQEMLCDFTAALENGLIPWDVIQAAREAEDIEGKVNDFLIPGLDVGRNRDESVLAWRFGRNARILPWMYLREHNNMEVARRVVKEINAARTMGFNVAPVCIDQGGIGGPVMDAIREMGVRCIGVNFGGNADDRAKYHDKASEMWGRMGAWLADGACIPDDDELAEQLAARWVEFDQERRIQLESKKHLCKERGMPSPDRADALALTHAIEFGPAHLVIPDSYTPKRGKYRPVRL